MSSKCYFGGGTAAALRFGEYRESEDIDFLVSDRAGYGTLREKVCGPDGFNALTRRSIAVLRPVVANQYGIRTLLDIDGEPIKFEIVLEGHITLEEPGPRDTVCGVATLSALDAAASKLLANSDRWADASVHSRDIIDLAMMEPGPDLMGRAIAKAESAYRSSIVKDLNKAIDFLRDNPERLEVYMHALRMDDISRTELWDRIQRLRPEFE